MSANEPCRCQCETSVATPRRRHGPATWIIAVALSLIAWELAARPRLGSLEVPALGQTTMGGARGVFAFSGQLSKGTYGVYMVDVDAMTTWVYEYLPQKGCLRLAAARTWRYDRYLENHNGCDLPPDIVEDMVETQREYRRQASENDTP